MVKNRLQSSFLRYRETVRSMRYSCSCLQQKSQTAKGLAKLLENYPEDKLPFPRREHHVPKLGTLRNPKENRQKSPQLLQEITATSARNHGNF